MKSVIIYVIILTTVPFSLNAQFPDTTTANKNLVKANNFKESHPDSAQIFFNLAAIEYKQSKVFNRYLHSINKATIIQIKKKKSDLALEVLKHAVKETLLNLDTFNNEIANSYRLVAKIYHAHGDYSNALKYSLKVLKIRQALFGKNHKLVVSSYNAIGQLYFWLGDRERALDYFHNVLSYKIQLHGKVHESVATTYNDIGAVINAIGDHDKALGYSLNALSIRLKLLNKNHPLIAVNYSGLGNIYNELEEYQKAIDYYRKALEIWLLSPKKNQSKIETTYINLAAAFNSIEEHETSLELLQKVLSARNNRFGKDHLVFANTYYTIGTVYGKMKYSEGKALYFLNKALKIWIKEFGNDHPHVATCHNSLAQIYDSNGNFTDALAFHNKTLQIRLKIYGEYHHEVVQAYDGLASSYKHNGDFPNAVKYYEKAINILSQLQGKFTSSNTKQIHFSRSYSIFENAIYSRKRISELRPNEISLSSAFVYSEKSKSNILREAFNTLDTKSLAGIPQDILNKDQQLQIEIASIEKKRFEETSKRNSNDSIINDLNSMIFSLNQEYDVLLKQIKNDFPDYHRLKYDMKDISVEDVQSNLLSNNQALVEYFVGDSSIYVFLIKQNAFKVYEIKKDFPLEQLVEDFRTGLYSYFLANNKNLESYRFYNDKYISASYQLYDKIVKPLKSDLPNNIIIVPDGVLGYLPFDALLMKKPKENHFFKSHDYLINDHQISYCYSASLLNEMRNKDHNAPKRLLAFAPSFKNNHGEASDLISLRSGFDTLKFNVAEVKGIKKIVGGDLFLGRKALEDNFTRYAADYQIVHLSTHGKSNDKFGDYSFLAFTEVQDSIENEKLYTRELYNLRLNADMVVLSACETGIGELQKGEGMISLARGFSYAGAKSIITTLWRVSDESTKEIMESFYHNIKIGMSKDEALQKAKLSYIQKHQDLESNPYYWAGFVPIGDMQKIHLKWDISSSIKYGLIAFMAIAFLFLIINKKRSHDYFSPKTI